MMACADEDEKQGRKKNFSMDEERVLLEKFAEHKEYLSSSFNNKVTNSGKEAKWKDIADAVDTSGVELRTTAEVRAKWKNMTSKAKETFHRYRKHQKVTRGGLALKPPSDSVMKTFELMQDDSSFKGVDRGISTFNPPGRKNPIELLSEMVSKRQ